MFSSYFSICHILRTLLTLVRKASRLCGSVVSSIEFAKSQASAIFDVHKLCFGFIIPGQRNIFKSSATNFSRCLQIFHFTVSQCTGKTMSVLCSLSMWNVVFEPWHAKLDEKMFRTLAFTWSFYEPGPSLLWLWSKVCTQGKQGSKFQKNKHWLPCLDSSLK